MAVVGWVFYRHIGTQLAWVVGMAYLALRLDGMERVLLEKLTAPAFSLWNCDFTAVACSALFMFSFLPHKSQS